MYDTPGDNPVKSRVVGTTPLVAGVVLIIGVFPELVIVYDDTAESPLFTGAVHETVAETSAGTATTPVGASGTVIGEGVRTQSPLDMSSSHA